MLVSWEIAKYNVHDASGVDSPEQWIWKKTNHVYYPVKKECEIFN